MQTPVVVSFPLRGEWTAPNTPGTRVPSHGTNELGVIYAYDFIGLDPESRALRYFRPGALRYLLFGARLQDFFGWGRPIFAAAPGVVVQAGDGWPERNPVHPLRDTYIRLKNARSLNAREKLDLRALLGNYVILETDLGYAVYAHAQTGSVRVSPGERVAEGRRLANVGHSGNSTAPHLHFHLMDHLDPWKAQGILCCFRDYEIYQDGAWRPVQNGIPRAGERLRKSP